MSALTIGPPVTCHGKIPSKNVIFEYLYREWLFPIHPDSYRDTCRPAGGLELTGVGQQASGNTFQKCHF